MGNGSIKLEKDDDQGQVNQSEKNRSKKEVDTYGNEDIRDKYDLGKVLGSGSFGEVLEAKLKSQPDRVRAVKIVEREKDGKQSDFSNSSMFRQEIALLQSVKHRSIVRFWDVYEDMHFLYVVMDLCRGGEVFSKMLEIRRFTEANAATLGAQMLAAIDYIHGKSIMHRDIKAENFLLSDPSPTSVVKMIDFGMATKFEHGQTFSEICGSPHYLAPELVGQKYDYRVDVWAFGITMYLIAYGHYPIDGPNTREIMVKILTTPIKWQTKVKLTDKMLQFLKKCLNPNPKRRITSKDALEHDFITGAEEPDIELQREDTLLKSENLAECVRSAHKKVTSTKKKLDPKAEQERKDKLKKIQDDFKKGIRLGARLGDTPQDEEFMSKPEHVRRSNRLITAPSKAATVAAAAKQATSNASSAVEQVRAWSKKTRAIELPAVPAKTARLNSLELEEKDLGQLQDLWKQWKNEGREGTLSPTSPMSQQTSPLDAVAQIRAEETHKVPDDSIELPGQAPEEAAAKPATRRHSRDAGAKNAAANNKMDRFAGIVPASDDLKMGG